MSQLVKVFTGSFQEFIDMNNITDTTNITNITNMMSMINITYMIAMTDMIVMTDMTNNKRWWLSKQFLKPPCSLGGLDRDGGRRIEAGLHRLLATPSRRRRRPGGPLASITAPDNLRLFGTPHMVPGGGDTQFL